MRAHQRGAASAARRRCSRALYADNEETRQNATNLDILLVALWFIPMTLAILLQTPVIGAVQMILKKKKARDEKTIVKKHHRVAPEPGPKGE